MLLHPDDSVEVRDQGRGIPVDVEPKTGLTGVEVVMTKLHAGGKFGGGSYAASRGLHGVGASVVNALSERMDVWVDRAGATHHMSFRRGEPGTYQDAGTHPSPTAPFTPFTEKSQLAVVGKVARSRTGTRIRYWADRDIFSGTARFKYDDLVQRARQTAFLVPGLTLVLRDLRTPGEEHEETFQYSGGTSDFVDFLAPDAALSDTWVLRGTGTFTESTQVLNSKDVLVTKEVERTCDVEVALRWGQGYDTTVHSFVNIIATPHGGTHQAGFELGLGKVVRKAIETHARKLKVTGRDGSEKIEKDDLMSGLTAVVTVRIPEPQFEGQTKEVLGTGPVRGIVAKVVEKELTTIFSTTRGATKQQAFAVLTKIVDEMRARVSARKQKELSRKKNSLETSSLPSKLADCRARDAEMTELFIVEGDSALGTAKLARKSDFQALLPIRGKILNVQKASMTDMLHNAECASIIQVIGAGSGPSFDLDAVRYGKIIVMTDADVDGAHIRTLLLTLFFRYMRPLVDAGRVYAAVPPLHRVEVAASARKKAETIYTYSEAELQKTLSALGRAGRTYNKDIQRYKGLGEMDADQLAETTMDPDKRTLRRITSADAHRAEQVFELLMGNDVAPRKEFIVAGSRTLDVTRIDA